MRPASDIRLEPSRRKQVPSAVSATRGYLTLRQQRNPVAFESSFERDFLVVCGATPQVRSVVREPFSIRYRDTASRKERVYTPDFMVSLRSGPTSELLVEVKREEDHVRYAARQAAPHHAGRLWAEQQPKRLFRVVTDQWMINAGLERFRLIEAYASTLTSDAIAAEIVNEISEHSWLTTLAVCERLSRAIGLTWSEAMPSMLALVAAGRLRFDVKQALTLETPIHVGTIACPFDDLATLDGPP